jgi:hypothetical protein
MLSHNDGFTDMEVFAQTQVPWLRTFLKRREYQATAELGKWPKAGSGALAKRHARLPLVSSRRITEWRTRPRDTLLPQQPAGRCRTPRANHPRALVGGEQLPSSARRDLSGGPPLGA